MSRADIYSDDLYATGFWRVMVRAAQLGWRYYAWDLPRYVLHRRSLGLKVLDLQAAINPVRDLFDRKREINPLPDGYEEAIRRLHAVGVRLSLPPSRVTALVACWQKAAEVPGDVIECGSYHGATALLMAVIGKIRKYDQKVLMLDTFDGSPNVSKFDSLRTRLEFALPARYLEILRAQAEALGVVDRVEVHVGEFRDTFEAISTRSRCFSFAHIDANLYQSTLDACGFVIPRLSPGGAVVFDDYHGPCDLGARLAIDRFLSAIGTRPRRLAGHSAVMFIGSP